jgi:hypothetical protein
MVCQSGATKVDAAVSSFQQYGDDRRQRHGAARRNDRAGGLAGNRPVIRAAMLIP